MGKQLLTLFTLFFTVIKIASADDVSERIKHKLQLELTTSYIKKLEAKFGECGADSSSCLTPRDNYMIVSLPKAEICFPYTMCGFYHCMEKKYRCDDVGINYFTKLAFPTCSAYEANIKSKLFTDKGVEWIYSVMVCLQKGLIDECEVNENCPVGKNSIDQKKTCEHITDFTLAYHPGCYIKSGVGVCHLPLKDKLNIWKTVNPFMTARERQEAYKVIFECLIPDGYAQP
ncbi:MAG: hypothetical protein WC635_01670 [Bacteriovorax sp.]|jgi:hypothetical protein